jgi:hypothetical protein
LGNYNLYIFHIEVNHPDSNLAIFLAKSSEKPLTLKLVNSLKIKEHLQVNIIISGTYNLTLVGNAAPTINPLGPLSVGEFDANSTSLGFMTSLDPDLDSLTYSIQSGNTDGIFQINPIKGQITVLDNKNIKHETGASYKDVRGVSD